MEAEKVTATITADALGRIAKVNEDAARRVATSLGASPGQVADMLAGYRDGQRAMVAALIAGGYLTVDGLDMVGALTPEDIERDASGQPVEVRS